MQDIDLRQDLIAHARSLTTLGLTQGTSGNVSARVGDAMLITPSGVAYETLTPASLALMPLEGASILTS